MTQEWEQWSPELWTARSSVYDTNSGLFLSQGQACLIDPGVLPAEVQAIRRLVEERGLDVRAIVLTHSHWDHLLGVAAFPRVPVVAQALYAQAIVGDSAQRILAHVALWASEYHVDGVQPFTLPPAARTFEREEELAVGDLRLRLVHAPGHEADQCVVHDPRTGTLWAADMLGNVEIPYVCHSLAAYEATLSMLASWNVRLLVPGHGQPTADPGEIALRLAHDRAYLAELQARVVEAVGQGKSVEETVEACSAMTYRHQDENRGAHERNVESAFVELGGTPPATPVGWDRWIVAS
ncbi:MAG TPA: MBL fold metallo-hydrolase [Anaerolineae bacterium]|nr:MBL fold metallo-hydrolase [Anaerolineae bacterium]